MQIQRSGRHPPETTAVDLGDQLAQWIVGGVARSPAHLKETGTAPNCEDRGKMLGVQGGGKEDAGVRDCLE